MRGGVRGRPVMGKFKPKAIRRGVEEREAAQREEEARRAEKEKATARAMRGGRGGGGDRGRGRGRGRGDAMGRGGLDRNSKVFREANGLFGVAPAGPGMLLCVSCRNLTIVLISTNR